MCELLRKTDRRGRSGVPLILSRTRARFLSRTFLLSSFLIIYITLPLLLSAGLTLLETQNFGIVLDALTLVRIWYAKASDLSGGLTDKLLVGTLDGDAVLGRNFNCNPSRLDNFDRVGVTDVQVQGVTLLLGTEADTVDFELLLEAGVQANDHVIDE